MRRMRTHTFRDTNIESESQLAVRLSAGIISSLSLKTTWHLVVLQSASNLITSAYLYCELNVQAL